MQVCNPYRPIAQFSILQPATTTSTPHHEIGTLLVSHELTMVSNSVHLHNFRNFQSATPILSLCFFFVIWLIPLF
uniref:Uncharacterized protein n=1 Tax=Rhizophora mucronata TaxID=61149 RepID=A0A2P2IP06_RHIMU